MSQTRGMTSDFDITEGQTPATFIFEPRHHSRFLSIGSISYSSTGSIDSPKKEAKPTIFAARVGTSVRPACRPESTTTSGGVKLATGHTGLDHKFQGHINRATNAQNKKSSGKPRASEAWTYPFKPDLDKPISSSPNMMFCICGGVNAPVASRYIRCVMCSRVQHTDCTIPSNKKYAADSEDYKCERCDPDAHIDHLSRESEKRRDEALALIDSCCGAFLWEARERGLRPHTNYKVLGEVAAPELKMPPEHVEFTRKDSVSIKPETQVFREGWKADVAKVTNVMDDCEIETLAWQLKKANNPLQVITRLADTVALLVRCQRFDRKQLVVLREMIGDSLP